MTVSQIQFERINRGIPASGYHERFYDSRPWQWYRHLLSYIVQFSQPGPILDVGCGTGLFVEAATRWGFDCVGIDGSEEAIRIASRDRLGVRVRGHLLSEPFPFADGSFQTVIVHQVIEHLEPQVGRKAMAQCFRVLRSGGMLYVSSPSKVNRAQRLIDATHLYMYSPRELHELLAGIGFENIMPMNSARHIFGSSRIGRLAASGLFRLLKWDMLSATADCVAYKGLPTGELP